MKIKLAMAVLGCSMLSACGQVENTPKGVRPAVAQSSDRAVKPQGALPEADTSVNLDSYVSLNTEAGGLALTYVLTSRSGEKLPDSELLSRLSPTFFQEQDSFKRQDIADAELPKVKAKLRTYRASEYYSLPFGGLAQAPLALTNVTLGAYDISSKSFPLSSYGTSCWSGSLRNQQGVYLKTLPGSLPCGLPVADENTARLIEAARAKGRLSMRGTVYLFVQGVEGSTVKTVPVHASIDIFDTITKDILSTVNL
ncbi:MULTISPECIES: hypothetical protein [unclassified Pseudomonas]|uniref:hypothetical protein n=1 Tax=unclassified Pseudomonas TaxID=196821 RepID=UPI000C2FD21B|nr:MULTISPECIES: hypothetical protein [unclassified Pseudomonas]MCU1737541.1 hypothetical protein [Pseudomonas sp. 20S_6.2_Bac1]